MRLSVLKFSSPQEAFSERSPQFGLGKGWNKNYPTGWVDFVHLTLRSSDYAMPWATHSLIPFQNKIPTGSGLQIATPFQIAYHSMSLKSKGRWREEQGLQDQQDGRPKRLRQGKFNSQTLRGDPTVFPVACTQFCFATLEGRLAPIAVEASGGPRSKRKEPRCAAVSRQRKPTYLLVWRFTKPDNTISAYILL